MRLPENAPLPNSYDAAALRRVLGPMLQQINASSDGKLLVTTVANLPTASASHYMRAMVTDANATTFASVVAGGGSNIVPVWCDGTSWRIG